MAWLFINNSHFLAKRRAFLKKRPPFLKKRPLFFQKRAPFWAYIYAKSLRHGHMVLSQV